MMHEDSDSMGDDSNSRDDGSSYENNLYYDPQRPGMLRNTAQMKQNHRLALTKSALHRKSGYLNKFKDT